MTRMLGREALRGALIVYDVIVKTNALAVAGRQDDALKALAGLADFVAGEMPTMAQVVLAQDQAAEALDLTKRTLAPFFPRKAEEHPHAANDHSTNPVLPSPTVA